MRTPLLAVTMLLVAAASVAAQRTTLAITGGNAVNFPNPTVTHYVNGFVDNPVPVTFSLTTNNQGGAGATVTATVEICAVNATLGVGKPVGDLKWRPSDLSKPYAAILQGCAGAVNPARTVVVHQMPRNTVWSLGVLLEMDLHWAQDVQASYTTPIQFKVSVVAP